MPSADPRVWEGVVADRVSTVLYACQCGTAIAARRGVSCPRCYGRTAHVGLDVGAATIDRPASTHHRTAGHSESMVAARAPISATRATSHPVVGHALGRPRPTYQAAGVLDTVAVGL